MSGWFLLIALAQAVTVAPQVTVTPSIQGRPLGGHMQLQSGHEIIGDHVISLWAGDVDKAMEMVSSDVENEVTNGKMHYAFPRGKVSALGSYIAMMNRGKSHLVSVDCAPANFDDRSVTECEFYFDSSKPSAHFTMRYAVRDGKIIKIYSWANRDTGKPD